MTPKQREAWIALHREEQATFTRWKRQARQIVGPTPAQLAAFDVAMDKYIAAVEYIIRRLEAD